MAYSALYVGIRIPVEGKKAVISLRTHWAAH